MENDRIDKWIGPTPHPKIVFLNDDALKGRGAAARLRLIVRALAQAGCHKLMALHVDQGRVSTVDLLTSVGFVRRQEMQWYEAGLRPGLMAVESIPGDVEVTDFEAVSAARLYPAAVAAFAERPIVGGETDVAEIISDNAFLRPLSFAAWVRSEIVGFSMFRRESDATAYFAYLGVVPAWRRRRIGLSLATRSLAACQEAGFRGVTVKVMPDNKEMIGLLRLMDFTWLTSDWNFSLDLAGGR